MAPFFRVPLLFPSAVIISRLDIRKTRAVNPPGAQEAVGYDEDFREPIPYESAGKLLDTRRYKPEVRVPCQVEVRTFEELNQVFGGDAPVTDKVFVLHNRDLLRLGLLETDCCTTKIKKNDRIERDEVLGRPGDVSQAFAEPLFIYRIDPGSWGMGSSGQDLQIVYTTDRSADAQ
jgi:hypothetical protein